MEFVEKFKRIVLMRIYSDVTIILLEQKTRRKPSGSLHIEPVTQQNVNDALVFQPASKIETFKNFLTLGHQGYYAYLNRVCVHRSWVVKGPAKVLLHKFYGITLASHEVFIQYCETAPVARGKNIFTEVLLKIGEASANKRVLISVDERNTSSQKSMAKAGFEELYRKRIRVILGFCMIR